MEILEIKKENAVKAFKGADKNGKALLENLFGKDILSPKKITDRVKTFEDAQEIVGCSDNMQILLNYNGIDKDMIAAQSFAKLTIINKALNEDWTADWTNSNQYKYYPWFKHVSGFGLSYGDYGTADTATPVGSRLCFKSSELAEYAAKQFADIYRDFLTL